MPFYEFWELGGGSARNGEISMCLVHFFWPNSKIFSRSLHLNKNMKKTCIFLLCGLMWLYGWLCENNTEFHFLCTFLLRRRLLVNIFWFGQKNGPGTSRSLHFWHSRLPTLKIQKKAQRFIEICRVSNVHWMHFSYCLLENSEFLRFLVQNYSSNIDHWGSFRDKNDGSQRLLNRFH